MGNLFFIKIKPFQVASLDTLLQIAMVQAKSLVKAEYCTVKLLDLDRIELAETKLTYVAHEVLKDNKYLKILIMMFD